MDPQQNGPRQPVFYLACRYIFSQNPLIVGVAYVELDCLCIKMCGISRRGDLLAPLTLALAPGASRRFRPPLCPICAHDNGVNPARVRRHGLVWAKDAAKAPDAAMKQILHRRVFGTA